jgi:hypothetical protein
MAELRLVESPARHDSKLATPVACPRRMRRRQNEPCVGPDESGPSLRELSVDLYWSCFVQSVYLGNHTDREIGTAAVRRSAMIIHLLFRL